tara:strand:- start:357 stop:1088 length:732 start_codon:yes stop_codon:yes gene_type:complete
MALDFAARIHALTGFNADGTDDTETGDDFDESAAQWMTDAAREVINVLPPKLKMKCATTTTLNDSTTTMDLDSAGDILFVTRLSANSGGYQIPCREVSSLYGGLTTDSTSLYYASVTDPVYWIDANTSGSDGKSATLYVKPTPEATQVANVHHIKYPTFTAGDTETYDICQKTIIANFPDEAEHLVVLRAAIAAAEYMLAIEEDPEIFIPMIQNLRKEYNDGLSMLIDQSSPKESKKLGDIQV